MTRAKKPAPVPPPRVPMTPLSRVDALQRALADREVELLALVGPCRESGCALHLGHDGLCDGRGAPA
jgi:hypothetical protein